MTEILDEGGCVYVINMDFKRAFDTFQYRRLLDKISNYGIKGKVLEWIKIFLTNRKQRVVVNGSFSRWVEVLSGIPQESVLGLVPFVLFINDLPGNVKSNIYLFADGTKYSGRLLHGMIRIG